MTNPYDTPEAKLAQLKKEYEYSSQRLKANQKRMNKLMGKLQRIEMDRNFWLGELQRNTDALYQLQFGDKDESS